MPRVGRVRKVGRIPGDPRTTDSLRFATKEMKKKEEPNMMKKQKLEGIPRITSIDAVYHESEECFCVWKRSGSKNVLLKKKVDD